MTEFMEVNRAKWDALTPIHAGSAFYDVAGFREGRCTVLDVERREVGNVQGKRLLHLQCHFGLDTLSWARLGAEVTGVDFSPAAVKQARELTKELSIPARFVCCNLYDLREHLHDTFDLVYTSQGVLCWLPDLAGWARLAYDFTRQGGAFYIHEFHPLCPFYRPAGDATPIDGESYAHRSDPVRYVDQGTYADFDADIAMPAYEWGYGLGDVVSALADAGFRIEFLHEFPHCAFQAHSFLERCEDGLWRWPTNRSGLPMMFSIRAVRP